MQHLDGFAPLAEQYDGFVIDLWGVVHDGINPLPGAAECLARLRAAGKPTVMLSNAPRRSAALREAMRAMGLPDDLYGEIMSSGEAVHLALRDPPDAWWAQLGRRAFHLGPMRDRNILHGLDIVLAERPQEADFLLNTGPDDHRNPTDLAEFEPTLRECFAAGLPMVCANPDLEVIRGGRRVLCAGALAVAYASWGGDVRSLGKPDPAIYRPVLEVLGIPADRVLAVGDSLRTDIAGAAAAGLASCWVLSGLHDTQLGGDRSAAEAAASAAGASPVATVPRFVW
ncbi:MAG: TIGR01459 family HAD-type hydrolase [Proteobacteria bacterium]|nr:TIGR01459 family HAD-type hydrolase [Pseudomonadota bacterium]